MGYGVFIDRINDSLLRNDSVYLNDVGGFICRQFVSISGMVL